MILTSCATITLITTPYDTQDNCVTISGVYRGRFGRLGEDVTHKINPEELVALLSQTTVRRTGRVEGNGSLNWSIYILQHGREHYDMQIMLGDNDGVMVTGDTERRFYTIKTADNQAIKTALERMIAEYDEINYNEE
jgi:hypothetical protein